MKLGTRPDTFYSEQATRRLGPRLLGRADDSGQSSTVEDSISFKFSDGITESVPCSYTEFAKRLVLPQYKNFPDTVVKEFHRRDGFEVASADKMAKGIDDVVVRMMYGEYNYQEDCCC
ncbi:hypothetical protein JHK87_032313 [Glycine soja]|nr:hypothetical protein JHK87_032313 [Glycine soja]